MRLKKLVKHIREKDFVVISVYDHATFKTSHFELLLTPSLLRKQVNKNSLSNVKDCFLFLIGLFIICVIFNKFTAR